MPSSRRVQRVEKELRNLIASYLLTEFKIPLESTPCVSQVTVSPDLKYAKVFISFLKKGNDQNGVDFNADDQEEDNIALVQEQGFRIQSYISKKLPMKFCPKLQIIKDEGAKQIQEIESILQDLKDAGSGSSESERE